MQVEIPVAESDVHLDGQPVVRGFVYTEGDQHGAVDAKRRASGGEFAGMVDHLRVGRT